MKPIIFLDIDGVLNHESTTERIQGYRGLDPELVERGVKLIADVGAEVVLSSTWRLFPHLRRAVDEVIPFIDVTPEIPNGSRGAEIHQWLTTNGGAAGSFRDPHRLHVVLDDDRDMVSGLVCVFTDPRVGLTEDVADRVRRYLKPGG